MDKSLVNTRDTFNLLKRNYIYMEKSVVDIEITRASSVLEILPKKQKKVMCQNLSLTW